MIRYLSAAVLAAAVSYIPGADAPSADEQKAFETVVTEAWKKNKTARRVVVAVCRPNRPTLLVAVGHADIDKKTPTTTDCHFRIASLSKGVCRHYSSHTDRRR